MSMRLMVQAMNCEVGNPARKLVLLKLADNANDDGVCFPSYQYIADKCEMSKRSAISHIDELIKMGLVSKKARKNKDGSSTNLYLLHLMKGSENSALGGEKISLGSENSALGGSENSAPITSHSLEPVNESTSSSEKNFQTGQRVKKYSFSPDDMRTAEWIFELLKKLNPEFKVKSIDNWANCVRLMRERDGKTHRDICELFQWANQDPFWSLNILSPSSLREKWVQLSIKKQASERKPHRTTFQERNSSDWGSAEKMEKVF